MKRIIFALFTFLVCSSLHGSSMTYLNLVESSTTRYMFDIAWSELLIIGVVALIVIGPKELPTVLRAVGQWMGKIRRMASEFQSQFQEAMREAEMADIKKQVDEMSAAASDLTNFGNFDPMETVRKEMEAA